MDILFIHTNYPAQFRNLCSRMASTGKHRIIFLTGKKLTAKEKIPGIKTKPLKLVRQMHEGMSPYLLHIEGGFLLGQAVVNSLKELNSLGFKPKLIIMYGGKGFGLFLKSVLPEAKIIGYFEWWLTKDTARHLKSNLDLEDVQKLDIRNMLILQELELCDAAVVPTNWQKMNFPNAYKKKIKVIFDGIDTSFFHPCTNASKQKDVVLTNTNEKLCLKGKERILSYATRGMETLRGFREFMLALPSAFSNYDNLKVIIAGSDIQAYSYPAPTHNGSWKEHMMSKIKSSVPIERIHFTGTLCYEDYRKLLWRSDLHCYFTRPYITSWSFFEAIACGAKVLTNESPATKDVAVDRSLSWTNLENQIDVNNSIVRGLKESNNLRSNLKDEYKLSYCLHRWEGLLNSVLNART